MPIVLKSGGLNLQEPSVPVQAYNGTALPTAVIAVTVRRGIIVDSKYRIGKYVEERFHGHSQK